MPEFSSFLAPYFGGAMVVLLIAVVGVVWLLHRATGQNESVEASFICRLFGFTYKTKNPRHKERVVKG